MIATRMSLMAFLCLGLFAVGARGHALDHMRTPDDIGLNKAPRFGTSHILVIPSRINAEFPEAEWEAYQTFFGASGGEGTFRHYWQVMSGGLYDPIPTLVEPVLYDECPIPDRDLTNCYIDINDFDLLTEGYVRIVLTELLERVRDEQEIDLSQFDVNGANCETDGACPDGFFDGVIIDTNMYAGVGFPLGALNNTVYVRSFPQPLASSDAGTIVDGGFTGGVLDGGNMDAGLLDGGHLDERLGPELMLGVVALIPPENHEFGHNLGFIDLYNGPTLNGLMATSDSAISAFSRLQAGWGQVEKVVEPGTFQLAPVYEGGKVLQFGDAPRYVLLENRGGAQHGVIDESYPGLHLYSVDEDQLPTEELGFIDILGGTLYYPNENGPYLNVSMPLDCQVVGPTQANPCAFGEYADQRDVEHSSNGHLGFHIFVQSAADDGTIHFEVRDGEREVVQPDEPDGGSASVEDAGGASADAGGPTVEEPEEGCGCEQTAPGAPPPYLIGLMCLLFVTRRSCRKETLPNNG